MEWSLLQNGGKSFKCRLLWRVKVKAIVECVSEYKTHPLPSSRIVLKGAQKLKYRYTFAFLATTTLTRLFVQMSQGAFQVNFWVTSKTPITVFASDRDTVVGFIDFQSCSLHRVSAKVNILSFQFISLWQYITYSKRPYFDSLVVLQHNGLKLSDTEIQS
jgi:hypothetical protein